MVLLNVTTSFSSFVANFCMNYILYDYFWFGVLECTFVKNLKARRPTFLQSVPTLRQSTVLEMRPSLVAVSRECTMHNFIRLHGKDHQYFVIAPGLLILKCLLLPTETLKFYKILSQTGTDFSLMATIFPKRNRTALKVGMMFSYEWRCRDASVSLAFTHYHR